jgi:hypothetical protein
MAPEAMLGEASMGVNTCWVLVDLPDGSKALGCRPQHQEGHAGNIERCKARLVVQGFTALMALTSRRSMPPESA